MYKSKNDLPETLRKYLPEKLQEVYLDAYKKSWESYEEEEGGELDREGVAHRDAMLAIEQDYVYHKDSDKWYPKGEQPKDEEAGEQEDEQNQFENIQEKS